jgi:hypothetical protein
MLTAAHRRKALTSMMPSTDSRKASVVNRSSPPGSPMPWIVLIKQARSSYVLASGSFLLVLRR